MNVFIRKSTQPGDSDNGTLFTTFFSVVILNPAATVLVIAGNTPDWNTADILWLVVPVILASLLQAKLFAGTDYVGSSQAAAVENTAPIVTVGVAIVFLGERLSVLGTVEVGLTFLGLLILCLETF